MDTDNTYIRFDWAIKNMLRNKANFSILEGFIKVLLKEDVKIEEILESESNQESCDDKFNRVDIKAKNDHGHIIIVEVQLTSQFDYLKRMLYGTSKTITEHINLGNKYDEVKKVFSISVLYCNFGVGDDYIYHGKTSFKGLNSGDDLLMRKKENNIITTYLPEKIFPEYYIIRLNSYNKIPESPLDEWMSYLKDGKIKEDTHTPGLQEVREKLRVLNMTDEERQAYFRHLDSIMQQNDAYDTAMSEGMHMGFMKGIREGKEQGIKEGKEQGIREGKEQGIREGKELGIKESQKNTALRMLDKGFNSTEISEILGIPEDFIDSLRD